MNFDYIEGLTEEQVKEYYENFIEVSDNISAVGNIWYMKCNDGTEGESIRFQNPPHKTGLRIYGQAVPNGLSATYGLGICGTGFGYSEVTGSFDDSRKGNIWEIKCSNGFNGTTLFFQNPPHNIGLQEYGACTYTSAYYGSMCSVCGSGRYGYARVTGTF